MKCDRRRQANNGNKLILCASTHSARGMRPATPRAWRYLHDDVGLSNAWRPRSRVCGGLSPGCSLHETVRVVFTWPVALPSWRVPLGGEEGVYLVDKPDAADYYEALQI